MTNKTLERLEIKDVFDNDFWGQNITCQKCGWYGEVCNLKVNGAKTKNTNIYRLNCPRCNKLIIDLSLCAWKN